MTRVVVVMVVVVVVVVESIGLGCVGRVSPAGSKSCCLARRMDTLTS